MGLYELHKLGKKDWHPTVYIQHSNKARPTEELEDWAVLASERLTKLESLLPFLADGCGCQHMQDDDIPGKCIACRGTFRRDHLKRRQSS